MFTVVVIYDICTKDDKGNTRLRHLSNFLQGYGTRVQNSCFELEIDSTQWSYIKNQITNIIDHELDSVIYYRIGKSVDIKKETIGVSKSLLKSEIWEF